MSKKVLMVAFHFPPNSSIGAQRTFKAAEYLPEFGWEPIILTAKNSAYDSVETSQEIPQTLMGKTYRTAALDVHRHLTIMGKHLGWMAIIDRWTTWVPTAVYRGIRIIQQQKPDLIWSTTPIPSAHIIGNILSKIFNIPWVADYRDPFSYHHSSTSKIKTKILKMIDKQTVMNCKAAIFTTPKATDLYREFFHQEPKNKFYTVENGYDELNWRKLSNHQLSTKSPMSKNKFSLMYSGVLYPNGRDATPLFQALQKLTKNCEICEDNFELVFQGAGDGKEYQEQINSLGISNMIKFTPPVPYLDSLQYLQKAEALVIIQGQVFNYQIPGKLYEYIRSGKPIIIITPSDSSTAMAAHQHPLSAVVSTPEDISIKLSEYIKGKSKLQKNIETKQLSRQQRTSEMAEIFSQIIATDFKENIE